MPTNADLERAFYAARLGFTDAQMAATSLSDLRAGFIAGGGGSLGNRSKKVWALGDSLTSGSPTSIVADAGMNQSLLQPGLLYPSSSWVTWAMLNSGAKWTFAGYAAAGGLTAAQIYAAPYMPNLIAAASPGDTVVVLAGTNGNVFADVKKIHDALRAAGLMTIAVTLPPSTSSTFDSTQNFNTRLKDYAAKNGIPLVDAFALLADPLTGNYLAANNSGDGVHPSAVGMQLLGYAINTAIQSISPPFTGDLVEHNGALTYSLQGHPLATGATNSADFTALAGLGTSTMTAPSPKASFAGGQAYSFVRGDTDINARFGLYNLVGGRKYRIGMALNFNAGTGLSLRLESNTTGLKVPWGIGYATPIAGNQVQADTRFYNDFVMPVGLPDYTYRLRLSLAGVGALINIGELTMFDLTSMGIV